MEQASGKIVFSLAEDKVLPAIELSARMLAKLHSKQVNNLDRKYPKHYLNDVAETAGLLSMILPDSEDLVEKIMHNFSKFMAEMAPGSPGLVHGDFYYGQVLFDRGKATLLDFDRSHSGIFLLDVGNYCAHLKMLSIIKKSERYEALIPNFVENYETCSEKQFSGSEVEFWTAYGLFQLAVKPFRSQMRDWPLLIKKVLQECLSILDRI
jgi:Ser/Thr protein kinase RdoA (MazF antagonist)